MKCSFLLFIIILSHLCLQVKAPSYLLSGTDESGTYVAHAAVGLKRGPIRNGFQSEGALIKVVAGEDNGNSRHNDLLINIINCDVTLVFTQEEEDINLFPGLI